jgi:hypothetical protein
MTRHKHYTFRDGQQVIEHGVRYLGAIRDALDDLQGDDHGERVTMLLDSVAAEHRNLLGSLERLKGDTTDKMRNTYTQYTVEMPEEIEPPEQPLTTLGLIQWLSGALEPLQEMFEELSENRDAEDATEVYASLAQQIESQQMRLSKEYQRTEDL